MNALRLVGLPRLMELTPGRRDVVMGLVDGPVDTGHPDLADASIRTLAGTGASCRKDSTEASRHGTFVAGILVARRDTRPPAIAPGCTLLVRPVFSEKDPAGSSPEAAPDEVADAIVDCVDAGARIINLSAAFIGELLAGWRRLDEALSYAAGRGALVVAAAGNDGMLGGSVITRHPWTLPVVAYELCGRPLAGSNLGRSVGRRGLGAPGEDVVSSAPSRAQLVAAGTSVAAPFVTATAALLWSKFPRAPAVEVKHALLSAPGARTTVVPPLLDAWRAYQVLSERMDGRTRS